VAKLQFHVNNRRFFLGGGNLLLALRTVLAVSSYHIFRIQILV